MPGPSPTRYQGKGRVTLGSHLTGEWGKGGEASSKALTISLCLGPSASPRARLPELWASIVGWGSQGLGTLQTQRGRAYAWDLALMTSGSLLLLCPHCPHL